MQKIGSRRLLAALLCIVVEGGALTPLCGQRSAGEDGAIPAAAINSVLLRDDVVFASTTAGVYRALSSDKVWHKVPLPNTVTMWGRLVGAATPSSVMVYYHPQELARGRTRDRDMVMCVSTDSGQTWEAVSTTRCFGMVFVAPDGSIYADEQMDTPPPSERSGKEPTAGMIDYEGQRRFLWHRVVVSHDLGKTWGDISEGLPAGYAYSILPSLDHPGLVRLSGMRDRYISTKAPGALYEADDANYHWKEVPRQAWRKDPAGREYIFCGTSTTAKIRADLSTLLKYPFPTGCDTLDRQVVQVEPERSAYTFRLHEPMPIVVKTSFVVPHDPLQFIDNKDETVCWTLEGYAEAGGPLLAFAKVDPPGDSSRAGYRDYPGAQIITLDDEHPYSRMIDLAKLAEFPAPGKYRVQLVKGYCRLAKQHDNQFAGQVIDVTITP